MTYPLYVVDGVGFARLCANLQWHIFTHRREFLGVSLSTKIIIE
jgi:hypothetical protein